MAMTKKRISGILLAVALFVGVFAATPAFASTTTPATGVTIDWAQEGISWTDKNIVVSTDKTFVDGTKEIAMPDADAYSDLKPETTIYIKKYYETADKAVSVEIPARPDTPAKFSLLADDITAGETSIKVNSPIAGQEFGIRQPGATEYSWTADGNFKNLIPNTAYEIVTRYPSTDKSFASDPTDPKTVPTKPTSTFFFNRAAKSLTLAPNYSAWRTEAEAKSGVLTSAKPVDPSNIADCIGSTIYVINNDTRGNIRPEIYSIDLSQPAAPAPLATTATNLYANFVGADVDAKLAELNANYEFRVISANNLEDAKKAMDALSYGDYGIWPKQGESFGLNNVVYVAIRTAADANNFASKPTLVSINQIPAAPESTDIEVKYDYKAETISFASGSILAPVAIEANTASDFTGDSIKSGDSIADLHGKEIYFRFAATDKVAASEPYPYTVKPLKLGAPAKPLVKATALSITISNFGSYAKNVEFSIDGGKTWSQKEVFTAKDDKVTAGTKYTVEARFMGDNTTLIMPSDSSKSDEFSTDKGVIVTFADGINDAKVVFEKDAALVYPETNPKIVGYTFTGWDIAAGTAVTADTTVNAQYKAIRGLKTIRKSAGSMSPVFSKSQKTYKVVLSKSTSSVKLVAKRRSTAQVVKTYYKGKVYKTYYKTVKLSRGASTTVKFYVKAADGKTTTYYVKVVRK